MKRFIEPNELARDSRFVRQDNAQATVLSGLPDDVDAVVNVFEKFGPLIEAGVRGTAAEPLFDKYGPGFALTTLNEPLDPEAPAVEFEDRWVSWGELAALPLNVKDATDGPPN